MTYGQVKSVRGQMKKDYSLLFNRVRLLETEMNRSKKNILETSKKTEIIKKIREDNDLKFKEKLEQMRNQQQQEIINHEKFEQKKKD